MSDYVGGDGWTDVYSSDGCHSSSSSSGSSSSAGSTELLNYSSGIAYQNELENEVMEEGYENQEMKPNESALECWICTSGQSSVTNPIIRNVCQCVGTSSAVHQRCINDLVFVYGHTSCSVCHVPYSWKYPDELAKLSEGQNGMRFFALLKYLVFPLSRRIFTLLCWIIFSFILVPFAVGSIYYYDQLQVLREVSSGNSNRSPSDKSLSVPLDSSTNGLANHTTAAVHKELLPPQKGQDVISLSPKPIAWWWVYIYAWVLGSVLGGVFRCVLYSWGSWKSAYLPHPIPDTVEGDDLNSSEAEIENETGFGQATQIFNLVRDVEKFVGYDTLEEVTLVHVLLGSTISLLLSTKQWLLIGLLAMTVCSIWGMMSRKFRSLDPLRSFSELDEIKRTFTREDILELFSRTVLRFVVIILLSGFCTFMLHVTLCSFVESTGTAGSVVNDINIIRLVLYCAVGFLFSISISAFDTVYMSPIFALGTSFFVFHSTQTTDELQRRLLDALVVRAISSNPTTILFRSATYVLPFFCVVFFFFAVPGAVLFGVRRKYWGDLFVSHTPGRSAMGMSIQEVKPTVASGTLHPPNPGEVALPLIIGFFHWTPEAFTAGGMMLYDWVRHMQQHLLHVQLRDPDRAAASLAQPVSEDFDLSPLSGILLELKEATRAGQFCQWMWEQVLLELQSENNGKPSTSTVIGPPLYSLNSNVGKNSAKPLVYNPSSSNGISCQVAAILFAGYAEERVARAIKPWVDISGVIHFSRKARWWVAHYMLRYPFALNWVNNFVILSCVFIALYCMTSVVLYRLHIRQLYSISVFLGRLFGLETYLFTEELRTNVETFLNGGDEVGEVVVPGASIDLLFAYREELMDTALIPSFLQLRLFFFFLLYYPCVVLVLWEAPLCGAAVCVGLTTQVVPLLAFSTCLFFVFWRPKYFFLDALPSGLMMSLSLILVICYVVLIQPIATLLTIRWNDLVTSSVMRAKGLRPKVVPRSHSTRRIY